VYPDPNIGMNNMEIPDISDEFNSKDDLLKYSHLPGKVNPWSKPYWYRTEFKLPESYNGKHIWLNFKGINYRADVWLNGYKVADREEMVGMFRRFRYDITSHARSGEENYLAVKIYPVDFPGVPSYPQLEVMGSFGLNGGASPKVIGKNVSMQCSVGWDWIPAVRDRNMGIWQDVYVEATGTVDIRNPHVITDLPLPDISKAEITIETEIRNVTSSAVKGVLTARIYPENFREKEIAVQKDLTLESKENRLVVFRPDSFPGLIINNPHLWWPNTIGKQNLEQQSGGEWREAVLREWEEDSYKRWRLGSRYDVE